MKGLKCIKYLALFITLLGGFVISSNVSAYEYKIQYLPFTYPLIPNNSGHKLIDNYFLFEGYENSNLSSLLPLKSAGYYFNFTRDSFDSKCDYLSRNSIKSGSSDGYYIPYYLQPSDYGSTQSVPAFYACYSQNAVDSSLYNTGSIPGDYASTFLSYLPYRYNYNGAYLFDSFTENGLNRQTKLEFSDLFQNDSSSRNVPDYVKNLRIPIGVSKLHFPAGTSLSFRGAFYLDSDDVNSSLDLTGSLELKSLGFYSFDDYFDQLGEYSLDSTTSCTLIKLDNTLHPDEFPQIIRYQCNLTIPSETNLSGFTLNFKPGSNGFVWSYPQAYSMIYDTSLVITDNNWNSPPSGESFQDFTIHSSSSDVIPGSADTSTFDVVTDGINWSQSLQNLFNFNLINPFAPLFGLFINQDRCVNIPTIAGMIHSQETQVCPWFDSTTRGIVTPVLGISSIMLLFGFVVRWLGGSSGNMFIDDDIKDTGHSFSLFNKYKRR